MSEETGEQRDDEQLIAEGESCVVYTAEDELQAQIIEDALREAGIPVAFESHSHLEGVWDGLVKSHAAGCGRIMVLQEDRQRAEDVIADLEDQWQRQAEAATDEDDHEQTDE